MKLIVDQKIFQAFPDLKIGVILIRGMNNSKRVSSVESLLRGICAQRTKDFRNQEIFHHEKIIPWAHAYGKVGLNPQKNMPSIAALLKRVKSGKEIPHINLLVDLYNYFSLKHLLPIGGEDLDWVSGDIHLTFTKGGESFREINSIKIEEAKEGEIAYLDKGGITARYWNHRECERTKFTERTENAMILIEDLSKIPLDEFGDIMSEMQNSIIRYIGGQIEPYILTEEKPTLDLGVKGIAQADDSKVPQQEKAHYMVQEAKKKSDERKQKIHEKKSDNRLQSGNLLIDKVAQILNTALQAAFPAIEEQVQVEYPAQSEHGDFASNIALQITKKLETPPREVAQKIIENIPENDLIEKTDIAGPGFINLFVKETVLRGEVQTILSQQDKYGHQDIGQNKNLVVEYSSPNIAKPLGVHHLLSTIIGQSLYNIYKEIGFNALSINHLGDWGTQFGKLIYAYKQWGNKEVIEKDPIPELLKLYVQFHDEAEKDASIEDKGREEFRKFEEGDKENHDLWQWFVTESLKAINKTFDTLGGIHFDYVQGESFYSDKMQAILDLGRETKVIEDGEEGAWVINFEDENIPTVPVRKKDGATLYITRDLAALDYRIKTWDPVKVLYVVDVAQSMHFTQMFDAARRMNICNNQPEHIIFGRMSMKDGKMSTRKGNIITLDEVLEEAINRANEIIKEKNPDLKDKRKVAKVLGVGAVKYAILSQNRTTNIVFDWDKILSLDGNSAPYLQYTYARANSIIRKSQDPENQVQEIDANLKDKQQKAQQTLLRLLPKYKEQILRAAQEYKPNTISNYIYELAQAFNSFYAAVPVLKLTDQEVQKERIQLVHATAQIIKNGLRLLGVEVVEEM